MSSYKSCEFGVIEELNEEEIIEEIKEAEAEGENEEKNDDIIDQE